MREFLVFFALALFAMATAFPQGVNVVDNNAESGQVQFVDNNPNNPGQVQFVDNNPNQPGQVQFVDNNPSQPGQVHVVDNIVYYPNNPGQVQIVDNSGYYPNRPGQVILNNHNSQAWGPNRYPGNIIYNNPFARRGD